MRTAQKTKGGVVSAMKTLGPHIEEGRGKTKREDVAQAVSTHLGETWLPQSLFRIERQGSKPEVRVLLAIIRVLGLDEAETWKSFRATFGNRAMQDAMNKALAEGDANTARLMFDMLIAA